MTYQQRLLSHLADYRLNVLGVQSPGLFSYRGKHLLKEHILPPDLKWLNLLPTFREEIKDFLQRNQRVPLHRYFHHLNSSQAFALNLFVPYFEGGADSSSFLLRALGQDGVIVHWEPEAVPVESEESNLDATWATSTGMTTICEVKLSESEFGVASPDKKHLDKLQSTYFSGLSGHVPPSFLEPSVFCQHYQILRNVWHAVRSPATQLLFLLPKCNISLWSSLHSTIAAFPTALQGLISVVAIEGVVEKLFSSELGPRFQAHAYELRAKYVEL